MKKGETFIGLDGKRYRVGKTVWRKDINKEIAKMYPYTPLPPKAPWLAVAALTLSAALAFVSIWAAIAWVFIL